MIIGPVLVDGVAFDPARAAIPVSDIAVLRGYGIYETVRSYGGVPFRLDQHLDRLETSASITRIQLPPRKQLRAWTEDRASEGDVSVRIVVTGGDDPHSPGTNSRVVVMAQQLPSAGDALRVLPVAAPWHPDGVGSELTGAKTLSYGPNVAATIAARDAGFDDALLLGRSGQVLEGPTYSVAWITAGVLETPGLALGILASITRAAAFEAAESLSIPVVEGDFDLARMTSADEVMALSTVKEVMPIVAIGDELHEVGPMTAKLAESFSQLVATELG